MVQIHTTPQLTDNGQAVACRRYLSKADRPGLMIQGSPDHLCSKCNEYHETVQEMFERVSFGNSSYYEIMANLDFLPNSPTLFNAGIEGSGTFSGCFRFDIADSMVSIMDVARKAAMVQKWGGGVGFDLSDLRGKGQEVQSTHGKACGPVAVMKMLHSVSDMITQGGKRHGAQMAILGCYHADVFEFIHSKDVDPQSLSTFNISVAANDDFMSKISVPDSYESKLFMELTESAWRTGDPGLYFIDAAERGNPTPSLGTLKAPNPCGEVPLLDNEPCNLGSINLANFVLYEGGFDFDRLKSVVEISVRFMDTILDNNVFPDPVITEAAMKTRKLGLGVMGWADCLAKMKISYDSQEALDLAEEVMSLIYNVAHYESKLLGDDKGHLALELATGSYRQRRNATLTCIAPTGTISILAGVSSGIEPHFAHENTRTTGDGDVLQETSGEYGGFVPKVSHEINWDWHLRHQAAFQEWTDLAVSKTINMSNTATVDEIRAAYEKAWTLGLKGVTVYRDESRDTQVLRTKATSLPLYSVSSEVSVNGNGNGKSVSKNSREKLANAIKSERYRFQLEELEGYISFGLYEDGRLGEILINSAKQGSMISGLLDVLAIMTSLGIQYGIPVSIIVEKFKGHSFGPSGFTGNSDIPMALSVVDYLAKLIDKRFLNEKGVIVKSGLTCPFCSAQVISREGCLYCEETLKGNCDYSKCE